MASISGTFSQASQPERLRQPFIVGEGRRQRDAHHHDEQPEPPDEGQLLPAARGDDYRHWRQAPEQTYRMPAILSEPFHALAPLDAMARAFQLDKTIQKIYENDRSLSAGNVMLA